VGLFSRGLKQRFTLLLPRNAFLPCKLPYFPNGYFIPALLMFGFPDALPCRFETSSYGY
jgi:hypothetical protein